jgi:hypothetical protein
MHRILVTLVLAGVVAITACSTQTPQPEPEASGPGPNDPVQAMLADRGWSSALESGDPGALSNILDDDFEWTNAKGQTRSKAQALDAVAELVSDFREETDRQTYHYGNVHVITSAHPGARTMRVWTLRPDGWRLFNVIRTELVTGATPFAAAGAPVNAGCDNPCRSMPFTPASDNEKEIARIFQQLKVDEWHPNPENWAPYVLDDVYYVTATAQLSKQDRVEHLLKLKETGAPSVPGDPVVSMRIREFGDSAVMVARHNPYSGGRPYHSIRVWAFRGGRWQLANTQQTIMADASPVRAVQPTR